MIVSALLVFFAAFLFYRIIKLGSFILIILGINPIQQAIYIFYGNYFIDDFFAENFLHYSVMQPDDINFILLNFVIYLAGIILFASVFYSISKTDNTSLRTIDLDSFHLSIDKLVMVYSMIAVFFLVSTELNNLLSKVMRLSYYYISFVPLLIGYFILDIKRSTLILFAIVAVFFVGINLLVGSRGYMAVIFVTITYGMLANKINRRVLRYYLTAAIILYVIVFPFLGFIELFRAEFGRIAYDEVDTNRIELLGSEYQNKEKYEKSSDAGFARNITWPNLSVMLLTGKEVMPIGFDNLQNDLTFIVTNTFISGKSIEEARQEYIDRLWGTGPANLYGYNVTLSNSVEFSVMADGIWRYGRFGFLYNLAVLLIIGLMAERYLIRQINSGVITLFPLLLIGNIYFMFITTVNGEPLISSIRSMIYIAVFSYVLSFFLKPFIQKS